MTTFFTPAERGEADGTDRTGNEGPKEGKVNEAFESEARKASQTESTASEEKSKGKTSKSENKSNKESWMDNVIDNSCRENSWFGKKCLKIFKVLLAVCPKIAPAISSRNLIQCFWK